MTNTEIRRRTVEMSRRVPICIETAVEILRRGPESLFGSGLDTAWTAREVQRTIGLELPLSMHIARDVRLGVAPPFEDDDAFVAPVWWEAANHRQLFPRFDGGLELRPLGDETELRLVGSYEPPLGAVGRFADDAVGHRIVTASLEALLTAAAERLESASSAA
ncbi:MAG TPA: hypothetical protein VI854_06060 [Acidimicrobiia bacterium]|nr:hypothetical protein [Acidimicrobiia bacterium]